MSEAALPPKYEKAKFYDIRCDELQPNPDQPRKFFDDEPLADLSTSIDEHGILQPVLFGQSSDGKLFIVAGERRYKAALKAGYTTIPAIFVEGNYAEIALIENILRQDLTPIELAEALQKVKDDNDYDSDALTKIIGKAKSTVSEILSLNKLPQEIKDECRANPKITRQVLINIAKNKTPKRMKSTFQKYKEQEAAKQNPHKRQLQRKTLAAKFEAILNGLKMLLDKDFETLDSAERSDVVSNMEELKKIADSFIKKIKPSSIEEKNPKVLPKVKDKKIVQNDTLFND